MKKLNTIILLFLFSCTVSQNAQQKKNFNKEKSSLWKYDEKQNLYSTLIDTKATTVDDAIIIWKKYKDYLIDKDTAFIAKEFGKPNMKDNKHFTYFMSSGCIYKTNHKPTPNGTYCSYLLFNFENNKLKQIVQMEETTMKDSY